MAGLSAAARYFVLVSACGLIAACADDSGPATMKADADQAMMTGDYGAALELYERFGAWKEDGAVSEDERFEASLESVKCLFLLDRTGEGIRRYASMFGEHAALARSDSYKHTLAVLDKLREGVEAEHLLELLLLAKERHPDKKNEFKDYIERALQPMVETYDDPNDDPRYRNLIAWPDSA